MPQRPRVGVVRQNELLPAPAGRDIHEAQLRVQHLMLVRELRPVGGRHQLRAQIDGDGARRAVRVLQVAVPGAAALGALVVPPLGVAEALSPRKLHPVLRAKRAEKDRFATGQKNYFFGCLMNVILDVGK